MKAFRENLRKNQEDGKYLKIFISIITVTLVPLISISTIIHLYSTAHFRDSYIEAKNAQIEKIAYSTDDLVMHFDSLLQTLGKNEDVINFVIYPGTAGYLSNTRIMSEISRYAASNKNIDSIYLYAKLFGLVLSSKTGLHQFHEFPDINWIERYEEHYHGISSIAARNKPASEAGDPRSSHIISFMANLPLGSWDKIGAVIINLDEADFYESIFRNVDDDSNMFILDQNGCILSHSDKSKIGANYWNATETAALFSGNSGSRFVTLQDEKIHLAFSQGDYTKWYFVSEHPVSDMLGPLRPFFFIMMLMVMAGALVVLFLDIRLSRRFYLPVQDLEEIEYQLDEAKPLLEEKILQDIIYGQKSKQQQLMHDLRMVGIADPKLSCGVILLEIDDYHRVSEQYSPAELSEMKQKAAENSELILQEPYVEHIKGDAGRNRFAVVVFVNAAEEFQSCAERFSARLGEISRGLPVTVSGAAGSISRAAADADASFRQAVQALEGKFLAGGNHFFFFSASEQQHAHNSAAHAEIRDIEDQTAHDFRMGLKEEMMHDIEKLSHAVRINYTDSLAAKQVFFRLIARIREILKKTGLSEQDLTGTDSTLEQEFSRKETLDDAAQWFSVIISDAVELMQNSTDTTRIAEAARNIIQYIDENISNKNISLNDIGDAVGLSPSYVSKVFKECYGYNYLEYLSRGRISRAVEYLKEDTYSISEIADMVGFASTQSFLRVFQKYQKTTPGKFRRNLRSSEDVQHEK